MNRKQKQQQKQKKHNTICTFKRKKSKNSQGLLILRQVTIKHKSTICYVHLALMLDLWLLSSQVVVTSGMCTGRNCIFYFFYFYLNASLFIYIIYKYSETIILSNKAVEKFCKAGCKTSLGIKIKLLNGQQFIRKMLTYFLYIV